MDPFLNVKLRVEVVNPTLITPSGAPAGITNPDERRHVMAAVRSRFAAPLRPHLRLLKNTCRVPRYKEGMLVSLQGQQWWVVLRIWNEAERKVIYLLSALRDSKRLRCLHEDFLVKEDELHARSVGEFAPLWRP